MENENHESTQVYDSDRDELRIEDPVLAEGNISPEDVTALRLCDSTNEVLEILEDVDHRRPRAA